MFKFILFTFLSLFSISTYALVFTGKIMQIDTGKSGLDRPLLFLSDGHVLKVNPKDPLSDLYNAMDDGLLLRIRTDKDRNVDAVETLNAEAMILKDHFFNKQSYAPTVLDIMAEAEQIFRSMRRGARYFSQCYSRAHVWAYESKKSYELNSMKVFLFFTRKYIREYNYSWWFHVSPFTYVKGEEGNADEWVLDFKFTRGPTQMKNWTDYFMWNDATCPSVTRYSQYENNQDQEYCYLYKASMHYFQPWDLKNLEATGTEKKDWVNHEVRWAYKNGFWISF